MPRIEFTSHLAQHVQCSSESVEAASLREALDIIFLHNPRARGYIMDDQGAIRKHVAIFIDSRLVHDRQNLDIPLSEHSSIYVMQALSGG